MTIKPFDFTPFSEGFGIIIKPAGCADLELLPIESVRALLKESGMVLFRDFAPTDESFRSFSDRFFAKVYSHGSTTRKRVSGDGTVVEVVKGQNAMSLHRELGYVPWSPDLVWFHCKKAPSVDGQTTVSDGVAIAASLETRTLKLLSETKLIYRHSWKPEVWNGFMQSDSLKEVLTRLSAYPSVRVLSGENEDLVRFDYTVSALLFRAGKPAYLNSLLNMLDTRHLGICEVVLENGTPLSDAVIQELRAACERLTETIQWHDHDVALIDNNRLMHGRRAFEGERIIHSRFGEAGK